MCRNNPKYERFAAMDKREALDKVRQYKIILGEYLNIESVYLYGSYARETNRDDSDIDVAVVVSNISGDFFAVNPLLWKLRRQVDDRIEPILIDKNDDKAGFLEVIKRSGIEIV
jgi:predicted nucleotidyltransferase